MNEHETLRGSLYGENSHVHVVHALEGLDPALAGERLEMAPYTIFQILHHMIFWQDVAIARLREENPARVESASIGWDFPPAPEDASEWEAAVARLAEGLREITVLLADDTLDLGRVVDRVRETTAREEILMVGGHNSYHVGQIVLLRQALGSWPPPKGGDTW